MGHKKKRRKHGEVELNLAAMLDMAFQLLTFFILTFRPAPVEGQVELRMPLPKPITAQAGARAGADKNNTDPVQGLPSLIVSVMGQDDGRISSMAVGRDAVGNLGALENKLSKVLGDEASGFDQVLVQVGSKVRYSELMQVLDVCTRQTLPNKEKLSKLSLVELPQQ